jgi:hypothetical protein
MDEPVKPAIRFMTLLGSMSSFIIFFNPIIKQQNLKKKKRSLDTLSKKKKTQPVLLGLTLFIFNFLSVYF